jgi:hypothetical protein
LPCTSCRPSFPFVISLCAFLLAVCISSRCLPSTMSSSQPVSSACRPVIVSTEI